ncbi:alanine racemase [Robbsia sp. Bb-Pol-6]|uniref:Alanine racemase n=1 Tax=Robbsia betulipollinis TaxID=2981849 RepID=A0ABT3ZSM1_9BURK|nr:alanine racemase [Robbsia betulipollinis]
MPRPIHAFVDTQAIAHNLAVARRSAPGSKVWAVVKANAYGHDIDLVYPALRQADGFALLDLDEAVRVRECGWRGPILLLEGVFAASDLDIVVRHGLTQVIHCDEQLAMVEALRPAAPLPVYLKMNSGMNRVGFRPDAYRAAWQRARACASIGEITLMTHFADADGPIGTSRQLAEFERGADGLAGARSLSNSAATLWHAAARSDWVRPGIMLYGASPSGKAADTAALLRPAMSLRSELIGTQQLQPGDTVGYGSTFVADRPMRIGVVACGYADGYPRVAPTGTPIAVDGVRTRVIGRVSMDMLTVDLTPCPGAGVATPVELWGRHVAIDEVAQACGTVGYELMTALTPRVGRQREPADGGSPPTQG